MQTTTMDVRGMSCGHCKMSVEGALKKLAGVSEVHVNLETGKVEVTYDEGKVTLEAMRQAVEDQGYDVA